MVTKNVLPFDQPKKKMYIIFVCVVVFSLFTEKTLVVLGVVKAVIYFFYVIFIPKSKCFIILRVHYLFLCILPFNACRRRRRRHLSKAMRV